MKKLDFVIAWVDGSDENHRLKRQQFQPENVVKGQRKTLDLPIMMKSIFRLLQF